MARTRLAHLIQRGAVYGVRFRIPSDLTRPLQTAELKRSLCTIDPASARTACLRATVWFQQTCSMLRSMPAPTRGDLEAAARAYFETERQKLAEPRRFPTDFGEFQLAADLEATTGRLRELELQLCTNDFDRDVIKLAIALACRR